MSKEHVVSRSELRQDLHESFQRLQQQAVPGREALARAQAASERARAMLGPDEYTAEFGVYAELIAERARPPAIVLAKLRQRITGTRLFGRGRGEAVSAVTFPPVSYARPQAVSSAAGPAEATPQPASDVPESGAAMATVQITHRAPQQSAPDASHPDAQHPGKATKSGWSLRKFLPSPDEVLVPPAVADAALDGTLRSTVGATAGATLLFALTAMGVTEATGVTDLHDHDDRRPAIVLADR